jgi:hypothetical protein
LCGKMPGNDECGAGKMGRVETEDDSDMIEGGTDGAARETTESWVRRLRVLHRASSASATTLNPFSRGAGAVGTPG